MPLTFEPVEKNLEILYCMCHRCIVCSIPANGYCRSEAISVILLQKLKDSRRVYARVIHAKTNCDGYKEQGITFPSGPLQQRLLEEFYEECQIEPSSLAWIEAHGTGTKVISYCFVLPTSFVLEVRYLREWILPKKLSC